MSEEKKKKKKAAIIAGIVGSAALIGAAGAAGGIIAVTETEVDIEEKKYLHKIFPKAARNLGTIKTYCWYKPGVEQINAELVKKGIDTTQVNIENITTTSATISVKTGNNAKYKGNPVTVSFTVDDSECLRPKRLQLF